ncbi:MAG TPA: cyanophycinase [Acidobacteriota bacterium]|nr:cyanophycinase [Acidobacteriota bacterium]
MKPLFFALLFLLLTGLVAPILAGPGYVVAIGGGSEDDRTPTSWSGVVYQQIVERGNRGKVVILGTEPESDFLPRYFRSLGASDAVNLTVSSSKTANKKRTLKALETASVVFIRGGDQAEYIRLWKGTRLATAIRDLYQRGGVVAGTSAGAMILGDVVYTAENGTIFPEEALRNPFNQYLTVSEGFLNLIPGVMFETHYTERGRIGRLGPMLARWWTANPTSPAVGIALDDQTAVMISPTLEAEVLGQGIAGVMRRTPQTQIDLKPGEAPLITHLQYDQLTEGFRFDVTSQTLTKTPASARPVTLLPPPTVFTPTILNGTEAATASFGEHTVTGVTGDPFGLYLGKLNVTAGSGQVPQTLVMPRVYSEVKFIENRTGGLFFGLATAQVRTGILMDQGSTASLESDGTLNFDAKNSGHPSSLVISLAGVSLVDFSTYSTDRDSVGPRQSAALVGMLVHYLPSGHSYHLGSGEVGTLERKGQGNGQGYEKTKRTEKTQH